MTSLDTNVLRLFGEDYKKRAVWEKGFLIPGLDPAVWRWDARLKTIRWDDYGNRSSIHGWELDHYPIPSALGGSDDIANLRPLNCFDNASLGGSLAAVLAGTSGIGGS